MVGRPLAVASLVFALVGCASDPPFLIVDFATDLAGGSDFVAIESTLTRGELAAGEDVAVAHLGETFLEPIRLTSFEGLTAGDHRLRVLLRDLSGDPVADYEVLLTVRGPMAVTAVISTACIGVTCPGAGDDPTHTACVGGRCVDARCSDAQPEFCPGPCLSDEECLGRGRCVGGVCLGVDIPDRCDDGDPCTRDVLVDGACRNEPDSGGGCDDGIFCNGSDTCLDGACTEHGTPPCGPDRCDEGSRTCDGGCDVDADCPGDVVGVWSTCAYDDTCRETGVRTREVTRFRCGAGRCEADTQAETDEAGCARDTWGEPCGTSGCGAWSDCIYAACQTDGEQRRTCVNPTCRSGACDDNRTTDTMPCSRTSQDGAMCSPSGVFCTGVCEGGTCGALCEHCGGVCTVVGCRTGAC